MTTARSAGGTAKHLSSSNPTHLKPSVAGTCPRQHHNRQPTAPQPLVGTGGVTLVWGGDEWPRAMDEQRGVTQCLSHSSHVMPKATKPTHIPHPNRESQGQRSQAEREARQRGQTEKEARQRGEAERQERRGREARQRGQTTERRGREARQRGEAERQERRGREARQRGQTRERRGRDARQRGEAETPDKVVSMCLCLATLSLPRLSAWRQCLCLANVFAVRAPRPDQDRWRQDR